MCEGHFQVLSVSGTPIHQPSTPQLLQQGRGGKVDRYSIFLHCLGTEQWKAGGYFQKHLEKMEDKVRESGRADEGGVALIIIVNPTSPYDIVFCVTHTLCSFVTL